MKPIFIPMVHGTKHPMHSGAGYTKDSFTGVPFNDWVGLRLDGYAVVDCDNMDVVKAWRDTLGTETPYVVFTARGAHFYYRAIDAYAKSDNRSYGDIDLKTNRSYVMAPGTLFTEQKPGVAYPNAHFERYTPVGDINALLPPDPDDLPPLPALALEKFRIAVAKATIEDPGSGWDEVPDGMGHGVMTSLAGSLVNQGMNSDAIARALDGLNHALMPGDPMPQASIDNLVRSTLGFERTVVAQDDPPSRRLKSRPFTDGSLKLAAWAWDQRIPVGELTILAGRPGSGKSTALLDAASSITKGILPGKFEGEKHHVLITATEDSFDHIIRPRFLAAKGDPEYMHEVYFTDSRGLSLPDDIDDLRSLIVEHDVKLLVVDPIISKLGKSDTNNNTEVRNALEPLAALSHETGCAVIGIMHFNKSGSSDPFLLLTGSSAFTEVPRSVLMALADPDEQGQYLLTQTKNSFADNAKTLRYTIEGRKVAEVDEGVITASKIVWDKGTDERTAVDIFQRTAQAAGEKRGSKLDETVMWLRSYLGNGPRPRLDVIEASRALKVSERTVMSAFKALDGISVPVSTGGPATWRLPANPEEISSGGNT